MQFLLSMLLAFMIMLVIVSCTTLKITFHYLKKGKDDHIKTRVNAWFGLIKMEMETSVIKLAKDFSGTEYETELKSPNQSLEKERFKLTPNEILQLNQRLYHWIKDIHNLHLIIKKLLKTIHVGELKWRSCIGTGSASETGMLLGVVWAIKGNVAGIMSHLLRLEQRPRFHVEADFQRKRLETELLCMIHFRIGNAIISGIRFVLNLRKRRDKKWQSTPFRA